MPTLTLRIDDATRSELEALAQGRGETVSDLVREAIDELLGRGDDDKERPNAEPRSLTAVERSLLASQHEVLAVLSDEGSQERKYHNQLVEVLRSGFTGEYHKVFVDLTPEVPLRDARLLARILGMFRVLRHSLDHLSTDAKAEIGEHADHALTFNGFDHNDSRELALARYVQFLVADGRWEEQEEVLERDGGNSHMPKLATYLRMLAAFEPLMARRSTDPSLSFDEQMSLDADDLRAVYAAWPSPRS